MKKVKTVLLFLTSLFSYITVPSRIISRSRSLIDNIFSNDIDNEISSGNIITAVFDHYAQFFLTKKYNSKKWFFCEIPKKIESEIVSTANK